MKYYKFLAFLLMLIALTNCNWDDESPKGIPSMYYYNGSYYTYEDLINQYNNGNLNGVIQLLRIKHNDMIITEENGIKKENLIDRYDTDAFAGMFNSDYSPLDVVSIVLNASSMKQYNPGQYRVSDPYNQIDINFGSIANKFLIDSTGSFPFIADSVFFPSELLIQNLSRFDTIHKSNDFDISWIGGNSSSKIEIEISKNNTFWDTVSNSKKVGFRLILDNMGAYTIKNQLLNQSIHLNGKYDLSVTSYTPVYKSLSNGKQLLFIGISKHIVTVVIAD